MSGGERDRMWQIVADIRDAHPRSSDDADSDEIIDALIAAGFGDVTALRAELDGARMGQSEARALARRVRAQGYGNDAGVPIDPPYSWAQQEQRIAALAVQVAAVGKINTGLTKQVMKWTTRAKGAEAQVTAVEAQLTLLADQVRAQGDVAQVVLSDEGVDQAPSLADELWLIAYNLRAALAPATPAAEGEGQP